MKILNTRRISERIFQIIQIKDASSMVNMIITNSIAENTIIPPEPDGLREEAKMFQKNLKQYSVDKVLQIYGWE